MFLPHGVLFGTLGHSGSLGGLCYAICTMKPPPQALGEEASVPYQ